MEIFFIAVLSLLVSYSYIKYAPMHDLRVAMHYEKMRNNNGRD